jgi:hypothetical protein
MLRCLPEIGLIGVSRSGTDRLGTERGALQQDRSKRTERSAQILEEVAHGVLLISEKVK